MEKKKSAVVRFTEGANNNVVSNVRVGHMGGDGVVFEGEAHSNKVTDFSVGNSNLASAIESTKVELANIQMDESVKVEIIQKMDELKITKDKTSLFEKYKSLINLADKHVKVLGAAYVGIKNLWNLF
ncbi:hypothetical protein M2407_001417 [Serratia sp. BIGb0234]|uniref:hypothetical protein n=1 Tax=Serratia sp. BIGb0234 TaxID=2940614 RepID=UPI002169BA33|nr:hypothetical protein [Serratia sp. BIGb0234]MCS4317096.1 hypothetical protein [Serratia sp. BIGb0234]